MEVLVETWLLPLGSLLIGAVAAFFGARSYYLSLEEQSRVEAREMRQLLVGSAETSVQNLNEVIDALRGRVERQESLIEELRNEMEALRAERDKAVNEVTSLQTKVESLVAQNQKLIKRLDFNESLIEAVEEAWADPPFKPTPEKS